MEVQTRTRMQMQPHRRVQVQAEMQPQQRVLHCQIVKMPQLTMHHMDRQHLTRLSSKKHRPACHSSLGQLASSL